MVSQTVQGATQGDLDALELMMDRMNRTSSPVPAFPPPRSSSRASSLTRLSTHSSSRSLHSVRSVSPRPSSPLTGRPSTEANHDETEDETTPSLRQGEWGRRTINHARARTTSDNRGIQRNYDDDTNSLKSIPARGPDDDTNPFYSSSSPASSSRWSPHTSPPSRPRLPPALGSTPSATSISSPIAQSPLRLLPRSPLNDRAPLEDLAFLREAGAFPEGDQWSTLDEIKTRAETDSSSIHSTNSASLRNARLREDIERTAQRIKEQGSTEDVGRRVATSPSPPPPIPPPPPPPPPASASPQACEPPPPVSRRPSNGFASSLPLYPGAPLPAVPLATPPYDDSFDDRSLYSLGSVADSTGTWPTSSHASGATSARAEYPPAAKEDRPTRIRQKESKEWSQACWIWVKDKSPGLSSGGSKFSKAPLIRDVPSVMKRKSGKRESAHHLLSPAEAMLFNFDDPSFGSGKGSKSSSSKDKTKDKTKDKGKSPVGPVAGDRDGTWKRASGVLRDDGYFRVFGEVDKIVIHSIHLPSYNRTDIRISDHSLFGRPNCVSISQRTASPVTPHRSSFASSSMAASVSSGVPRSTLEDAVYLCFPSVVATQVWLVMAHCFARPEYYLASGSATPRPAAAPPRRTRDPSWPSSDEGEAPDDGTDELATSCRIYRKLHVSVNEGRALGESMTEANRPGAKVTAWDRPGMSREGSSNRDGPSELRSPGVLDSPSKSIASSLPTPRAREGKDEGSGTGYMCEIEMDGEVVARTATRRGNSPFWNESFSFSDLPPFTSPITVRVLQSSKSSSRLHVLGSATVRVPDLPRHELSEDWWSVKPVNAAKMTDVVGELNLGIRIGEEVVLPSREYETILKLLTEDLDADLAIEIAQEFPSDLEELTSILLRIYQAESLLVPRLLRLADLEIDNNNRLNRSSAILFRGNTILTKSVELYLRLIGAEYLEASIGEVIRKIIKDKVEIEIDPMKLKSGWKDKELISNVHALHEWTTALWNSIYDARERCPQDLRQIFGHIQNIVVERYGIGEDQKNTRWTSVSAFIFLRFFVPAVLNPRLFYIVSNPPDAKSQRTLTLIAKTLQGLANFSSFGQKEPWMLPMNSFVQDNGAAFMDFIGHVATPTPATAYRQEWTSPLASTYLAPYRLRDSLAPLAKEGVALLPHLIDLPRELGLLATHLARWTADQARLERDGSLNTGRSGTPSASSSNGANSQRFIELAEACHEAHNEARRRGGGLVSALNYYDLRSRQPDLRTRAGGRMSGRPATSSGAYGPGVRERSKLLGQPASSLVTEELLHIRNPSRPTTPPAPPSSRIATATVIENSDSTSRDTTTSRRSHRSFTINGASPGRSIVSGGALKSLSSEDLSALAAIQTRPSLDAFEAGPLDGPSADCPPLAPRAETSRGEPADSPLAETSSFFETEADVRGTDAFYDFPPTRRGSSSSPKNETPSAHSPTTSRTHSRLPTSVTGVRINQETTTSTTRLSQLGSPTSTLPLGNSGFVIASSSRPGGDLASPVVDDSFESPSAPPYESEFGSLSFFPPPLRSPTGSAVSSPILASRSQGAFPTSASTMSISAEVSASPAIAVAALTGRRSSSAGIFGLGKSSRSPALGSAAGGGGGGPDDETSSTGSSGGGSGARLWSRAMGRKGSKAS